MPEFNELSVSDIDSTSESLYPVCSCTHYFSDGSWRPIFSHLALTGHVLHFQSPDWADSWHSCCSVSLVAFDVASLSCTVECGFVAPFKVVTSI